uniref:Uncharacterized protein n=1 Tax=Rhizophora mucronata TaxID=61149 RepID=A0A2P2PQI6_RHIMU
MAMQINHTKEHTNFTWKTPSNQKSEKTTDIPN